MINFRYNKTENGVLVQPVESSNYLELNCSIEDFERGIQDYDNGALIQNAFPFLSADEREFLILGLIPGDWEKLFGKNSDYYDGIFKEE